MDIKNVIEIICDSLSITETALANELGISYMTINLWKNQQNVTDDLCLEKLYSFAYHKGIKLNNIYEQLYKEDYSSNQSVVLFHGAKRTFSLPIDFASNSKRNNDFGMGFYLGESFEQAANNISFVDACTVYCFQLALKDLKSFKFEVNAEWMIAIAYFRGWIDEYKNCKYVKSVLNKINSCDVIIAPIADNRMFDIIADFVEGNITDEQCRHSLAATNLGLQYVLKTNKAIESTHFIHEMYVCKKEKETCVENRSSLANDGIQKVRMAKIQYKGKGKYFEEIMK